MKKEINKDYTRELLNRVRDLQDKAAANNGVGFQLIKEEKEKTNAIAITDDPKFGDSVLSSQIEQFRSSVDGGAQFSSPNGEVAESPLIYLPDENNLIFSGTIPRLNNLKFQMKLRTSTGEGCFVFVDGLILSNENLKTLTKLYGFYNNWKNSWESESRDLEMLKNMLKN